MTTLHLPQFCMSTTEELAQQIGWRMSLKQLTALSVTKSDHYKTFQVRKASGAFRTIYDPSKLMRVAQYLILKNLLSHVEIPPYIHAFEAGRSVAQMAAAHSGKALVVSVDVSDYFPSIKQRQVLALLNAYGMTGTAATVVSELCTYKAFLPQGGLTSPKLSNIFCASTFGPELSDYCATHGVSLTIYADDITLSWGEKPERTAVTHTITFVQALLRKHGLRMNRGKTKVMSRGTRQYVCGAVVNDKVNLMAPDRRRLRAIVHNCKKNGVLAEAKASGLPYAEFVATVRGRLGWYAQLNEEKGSALLADFVGLLAEAAMQPIPACSQLDPDNTRACDTDVVALTG